MTTLEPHAAPGTAGAGDHRHALLGAHATTDAAGRTTTTIRVLRDDARSVTAAFTDGTRWDLVQVDPGVWQIAHPGPPRLHRIVTMYNDGTEHVSAHDGPTDPSA